MSLFVSISRNMVASVSMVFVLSQRSNEMSDKGLPAWLTAVWCQCVLWRKVLGMGAIWSGVARLVGFSTRIAVEGCSEYADSGGGHREVGKEAVGEVPVDVECREGLGDSL